MNIFKNLYRKFNCKHLHVRNKTGERTVLAHSFKKAGYDHIRYTQYMTICDDCGKILMDKTTYKVVDFEPYNYGV